MKNLIGSMLVGFFVMAATSGCAHKHSHAHGKSCCEEKKASCCAGKTDKDMAACKDACDVKEDSKPAK